MTYANDHFGDDAQSEQTINGLMLDEATAERLLEQPESSVPPGYAKVARLLTLASAPALREELAGEQLAVVAFLSTIPARPLIRPPRRRGRWAASGLASIVLLSGGVAAAATGSLPGPAQDAIAKALDHVGVDVPMSNGQSVPDGSSSKAGTHGNGSVATDTKTTGVDNGAGNGGVNQGGNGKHTGVSQPPGHANGHANDHTKPTDGTTGNTGVDNGIGNGGVNQGGNGNHTGVTTPHVGPTEPTLPPKAKVNSHAPQSGTPTSH